jgi:hypothetical protein
MSNPLVTLNNAATLANDFKKLLAPKSQALLIVLGNTPTLQAFAQKAASLSVNWRQAVLVASTDVLYPVLLGMPADGGDLPPVYDGDKVMAVSISFNGTVCDILDTTEADNGDINAAYMLAETYKPV